jgi:hypothetical protein
MLLAVVCGRVMPGVMPLTQCQRSNSRPYEREDGFYGYRSYYYSVAAITAAVIEAISLFAQNSLRSGLVRMFLVMHESY